MAESLNKPWNLESFLDSLIVELDKAQDTLSVKGITRKLTYTVRDVALDLQIFPQFDGGRVRFTTAKPGESGSSKISIQLGSITDRQIKETTREPISRDELSLDAVEGIDDSVRDSLRKVGVTSAEDFQRMEQRNVDVAKVVKEKTGESKVDYANLARLINQSRRKRQAPRVSSVSLSSEGGRSVISVHGEHLATSGAFERFPAAALGDEPVEVLSATDHEVRLAVPEGRVPRGGGGERLRVALDPYAMITMEIVP